jgi:hypothetical protein
MIAGLMGFSPQVNTDEDSSAALSCSKRPNHGDQ